ncbi:MAG: hypothetical protein ACOH1E_10140 [Brevundimonas sp.]
MPRNSARLLAVLLSALWLAGCGTIDRPEGGILRLDAESWRPTEDPRIRAGDTVRV